MTGGPPDEGGRTRSRRWRWLPAVAVVVAVGVVLVVQVAGDGGPPTSPADRLAPVEVSSDAPRAATLPELAASADLVVRAQVLRTEEGRLFGEPGGAAAIRSRVLTLQVVRVLRGAGAEPGERLLVEEEGWTLDGAQLVVDGLAPSAAGDDAVWFLRSVGVEEEARHVVVSAQGRYLVDGDRLQGRDREPGADPLVEALERLGPAGLEAAVTALG